MRIIFESDSRRNKILHNLSELERNLNKDLYVDFDLEIDTAWLDTPEESNKILSKLKDVIDLLSEENTDATWLKYDLDLARNIYRQILTLHGSSNKLFLETVGQDGTSYEEIASKSVPDADGFYTDYTMYYDILNDKYVFVFGDKDIYTPYYSDHDWECETEEEAWEWYNDYNGFEDEDIVEESLKEGLSKFEIMRENKALYSRIESAILKMPNGLKKLVLTYYALPWCKNNNWMGGMSDSKSQAVIDKLVKFGYDEYEIMDEMDNFIDCFNPHGSSLSEDERLHIYLEESLKDDTIKTKDGKWTNKGEEGTHGKFKTKKEADAQRRAIWVNWNK